MVREADPSAGGLRFARCRDGLDDACSVVLLLPLLLPLRTAWYATLPLGGLLLIVAYRGLCGGFGVLTPNHFCRSMLLADRVLHRHVDEGTSSVDNCRL